MICRITDGFLSFSAEIKKFIGDWGKVFGQNMKDMEKEDSECHNFTREQTHKSSKPDNKKRGIIFNKGKGRKALPMPID